MAFSNPQNSITIPEGATTGPRVVIGNDVPAVLQSWATLNNCIITAVVLKYWNTNDFKWEAVGSFVSVPSTFTGTYDTVNGVYVIDRILNLGAGSIQYRVGSYSLNTFQLDFYTSQSRFRVGDTSYLSDDFAANVDAWHNFVYLNGWANSAAGQVPGRYRKVGSPANSLQIVGECAAGTKVDTTIITNLPVGYRPLNGTTIPVAANPSTAAGSTTPLIQLKANGDLIIFGIVAATGTIYFSATLPLDA